MKKNLLTIAEIIDNGSFTETPVQELRRLKRIAEKKPKPYDKKQPQRKEEIKKQVKNLFKKLLTDENSIFYSAEKITKNLLKKAKNSSYEKVKVFYKLYSEIEDSNVLFDDDIPKVLFYTPFLEQRKDIDCSSALYSITAPFELVHADVADIRFLSRSAVNPKYCLLYVDPFSSKVYVYPMKKRATQQKNWKFFMKKLNRNAKQ